MRKTNEQLEQDIQMLEVEIKAIKEDLTSVKSLSKPKETVVAINKLLQTKEQLLQIYKEQFDKEGR